MDKKSFQIKKIFFLIEIFVFVFLMGVLGYIVLENYTFLEAVYMTAITISTVGYTEVRELSEIGRIFTVVLIFVGISVALYALSSIAAFLVEGEIKSFLKGAKMKKTISKLKKHYIICGAGRTGTRVVEELVPLKKDFLLIEKNEDIVRQLEMSLNKEILYINGDATKDEVLEDAGIKNASHLVAALASDADNVFLSLSAKSLNKDVVVIARSVDNTSEKKLKKAGADQIISPFEIAAKRIVRTLINPGILNFLDVITKIGDDTLKLEMIKIESESELAGLMLKEAKIPQRTNLIVIGIKTGTDTKINPLSETKLYAGSELIVLGDDEQIERLKIIAGQEAKKKRFGLSQNS